MDAESIQSYAALEKYYWWFVGRRRVIRNVLNNHLGGRSLKILDWGCGPGGNFAMLESFGEVLGVDASTESLEQCRAKGIHNVRQANTLDEFDGGSSYDLFTTFDVLEHIDEDEQFLNDIQQTLLPGGHVLVTVPAYQFLWSQLDALLGHVRRYSRQELVNKFNQNGYQVIQASYFNSFLAIPFIVCRMIQNKFGKAATLDELAPDVPRPLNWFFTQLIYLEASMLRFVNLPFGTSIVVLARKTDAPNDKNADPLP